MRKKVEGKGMCRIDLSEAKDKDLNIVEKENDGSNLCGMNLSSAKNLKC